MLRGRKVTDPVVHGASGGRESVPGLAKAWDTVGKAKSDLRKIEQRLVEHQHPLPQLNQTGETSITDYGGLELHKENTDRLDNQDAQAFASGAVVDNYGRSAYLRSKTQASRKISRLDDKYVEEDEKGDNRKPSIKKSTYKQKSDRHVKQTNLKLREKNYDTERALPSSHDFKDYREKRVEFSDRLIGPENHMDRTYGIAERPYSPNGHSTLTDSRDIRETEIHFLNNNLTQSERDTDVRWSEQTRSKLTHVSVTVPGSTNTMSSTKYTAADLGHNGPGHGAKPHFLDLISDNQQLDRDRKESVSDHSYSDSESSKGRRFKTNLKNIDPDGLAKIKETIQKQIKSSHKENHEDGLMGATGGVPNDVGPSHQLHDVHEPIIPRSQDLIEGAEKHPKVRKIAAGPALPHYKGFSEAEIRYKLVEKAPKTQDVRRKDKKPQVKVQTRRSEPIGSWLAVEEEWIGDGTRKKITRVIAPSRKPTKQQPQPKNKEIITTSSWRVGQELILRELGPARKKTPRLKETRDDDHSDRADSPMEARPEALVGEEYPGIGVGSATAAEIDRHKALSEEAKKVYNDLHYDSEEEKKKGSEEKRRKVPIKRKAPKSAEPEKQVVSAKHRHYDQDEVRKYMQRQKADRLRQQKEEERRQKEIEEARKKHLEELSSKQKQAAAAAAKREKSRPRGQDVQSKPVNSISDLPKHHPFHKDHARFMLSSESENKENHYDDADMDISDGSSTITEGGSVDDLTPNETPRKSEILTDTANMKPGHLSRDNKTDTKVRSKPSDNSNTANVRTVGGFTFEMDGVMSKFTQALHEKLNEEPRALRGNSGYASVNSQNNVNSGFSSEFNSHNDIGYSQTRSKQDRLKAIKETAATLQSRLQEEKRKFQGQPSAGLNNEIGATNTRPAARWNDQNERDFVSRYERITAATDDFTVFKSNLPGTQPGQVRIDHSRQNDPSRKTRAATENTRLGVTSGNRKEEEDIAEDVTLTETSTFSEITLTDESDTELSPRKPGTKESDYHVTRKTSDKPGDLAFPRPGPSHQPKASSSWDETTPDPYNVFSIYTRRQQEKLIRPGREPMSMTAKRVTSAQAMEPLISQSEHSTQATAPRTTSVASPQSLRSRSPGAGGRAEGPGRSLSPYGVPKSESLRTKSPVDKTKSRQMTVSFKPLEDHNSDEDTLGEESYSASFASEDKSVSEVGSASEMLPQSHRTLPSTSQKSQAAETELSMDEQDMEVQDSTPRGDSNEPKEPARLSPNSLERRFLAELHQLDSMEMSMKQLTGVERTRAVSMAQQETVSLAQMLKARQQAHDLQMKELQNKAKQEATEATKQLEEAIKRASDPVSSMAEAIGRSRGQDSTGLQESTRKFFESQTEAVRATAEAAKLLSERIPQSFQDTKRLVAETAAAVVTTAFEKRYQTDRQGGTSERGRPVSAGVYSARSATYSKPSKSSSKSASSKTRTEEGSSVRTGTGAEGHDDSEIASADDQFFDDSMTEDEREEKSFRTILPSESHRKKGKHIHSDNESVTSGGSHGNLEELHSLFAGEESFDKFTDDIVKQFMKEEELRAQHQASLLRLRENALVEKTKAELAWLEQQRQRFRNKGADDNYPTKIVKRQRGLKLKLQEQQAEIRKLREANKAAARERQKHLFEEIAKKRQQSTSEKEPKQMTGRLGRPSEVHTEAEVSSIDELSDVEKRQRKDYKSDSEIYTESKGVGKKSKTDSRSEKYKKIHLDEKFLTHRQLRLMDRRKNAEELLKWKELLDTEEKRVLNLEKKALKVWDQKENDQSTAKQIQSKKEETEPKMSSKNGTTRDSTIKTAASASVAQDSTIISENISTARDDSIYTHSIKESPRLQTASPESSPDEIHKRRMNDKSNLKNHNRSESESSLIEDIQSQSSHESKKNDSSDDTMTHSYENETFEETTTTRKTSKSASKSPLEKLKKYKNIPSPISSFRGRSLTRNSESESEDSISYTETQSDLSDFEGRIRALNEELRRRKTEADKLKRERKKKRKELMKNKEESLKKQIEAYDNQISQLKVELQKEMEHEPVKTTVKPQIKQPKVSPPKALKKTEITPPKQKSETESSGADSTQVSPSVQEEKDQKQVSIQKTPVSSSVSSKVTLDRISEGSESQTSRSEKSELSLREKLLSLKGALAEEISHDVSEEIAEEIIEDISEISEDKSAGIEINLKEQKEKEDMYDVTVSYTEDFTAEVTGGATLHEKLPLSPHSEITEAEPKTVPLSARSGTEISEHISEPAGSVSESFIKPLELEKDEDIEKIIRDDKSEDQDQESDIEQTHSSITRTDSRPSSDRSLRSYDLEHESSESDKSIIKKQDRFEPELVEDEVDEPSKKSTGPVGKVLDIDDLLSITNEMLEQETPVASPRRTPVDISQRDSETPKIDDTPREEETPREDETPRGIETPLFEETPIDTPRSDETSRNEFHHMNFVNVGDFEIGDRVSVTGPNGARNRGTLLFKGNVQFAPGVWAGVELDRPVGRHDGSESGIRYFRCRLGHGVFVPGHDLMPLSDDSDEEDKDEVIDVRSSIESTTSSQGDELLRQISEADQNVRQFGGDSPVPSPRAQNDKRRNEMADKITDHIFASVIKENYNKISEIADKRVGKKVPPPVAPKPKPRPPETEPRLLNGDINELEEFLQSPRHDTKEFESTASSEVNHLMNDAIDHMLAIRNNRMGQDSDRSRDSGNFTDGVEDNEQGPTSPTEELEGVLNKQDEEHAEAPVRPGSPIPGMQSQADSHKHIVESGIFEGEFDDEFLVPTKAPPPYPGSESPDIRPEVSRSELQKLTEELYYAVPHQRQEVSDIVSSAVDTFWNQRRYGEPLEEVEPPSSYFSKEEQGEDLISNSKRVFKRLLFDLTGEVIKDVYKEEEYDSPLAWHKPKRKQNKYYKGSSPPTTVDVLKPVVQEAVIDILGLNGSKKTDRGKWGIRKKKDLVDSILVQELREEEPQWVNYDDDELAVKMQLTETIFESLLTDTVQTMNKIFRKRQSLANQSQK